MAESSYRDVVAHLSSPLRDMFTAVFLVSMGALMDFSQFALILVPGVIVTLATIGAKLTSIALPLRIMSYGSLKALRRV